MKLRRIAAAASTASLALLATHAWSADMAGRATFVEPSQVKWGEAPPVLPKGAQLAVLQGDPSKAGPFVIRIKVPGHYKVAARNVCTMFPHCLCSPEARAAEATEDARHQKATCGWGGAYGLCVLEPDHDGPHEIPRHPKTGDVG